MDLNGTKKYEMNPLYILSVVTAAFLYLCYMNYSGVVYDTEIIFYGTDPYYHARRIWLTALQYPSLVDFDWYVNFPKGAYIQWPPGFDYLLATIVRVTLGPEPSQYLAGLVTVLVTPLLGVLVVPVVYRLTSRDFGHLAGVLAVIVSILNFSVLNISRFGRVDHHMLEVFFLALIWYMLRRTEFAGNWKSSAAAGAALAFSYLFVPVSNLFPFILFGFFVAYMLAGLFDGRDVLGVGRTGTYLFIFAAAIAYPLSLTSHFARIGSFDISPFSLFQPSITLSMGIGCALLTVFAGWWSRKEFSGKYLFAGLVLLTVVVTLVVLFTPLRQGLDFLSRADPISSSVLETRPALYDGFNMLIAKHSMLILLSPFLAVWALITGFKRNWDMKYLLISYMIVATYALAMMQGRLMQLHFPVLAVGLAAALANIFDFIKNSESRLLVRKGVKGVLKVILIGAVLATLIPSIRFYSYGEIVIPTFSMIYLSKSLDVHYWLKRNTPEPGHYTEPSKKPTYGVLGEWGMGHYLNYLAQRPNIGNPFGWGDTHRGGVFAVSRFLIEDDEEKAARMLDELEVKYVIVEEPVINMHIKYMGLDHDDFYKEGIDGEETQTNRFFNSIGSRLYYIDGSALNVEGHNVYSLGHFRLVYDSWKSANLKANTMGSIPFQKVFEYVKGAELSGKCTPEAQVVASVDIKSNWGRTFTFNARTTCSDTGNYMMRLPYSTEGNPYETIAEGAYKLTEGGGSVEIKLPEDAVVNGSKLKVDLI
jgi:dolichyl-diphosphooligosaccharide--protein glycosyltransferase